MVPHVVSPTNWRLVCKGKCWTKKHKLTKKDRNQLKTHRKTFKKVKNQPEKLNFEVPPPGVDQFFASRPALRSRQKPLFCSFTDVFCWFQPWNQWKRIEMNKIVENGFKKCFNQLSGAASTWKLVKIHNSQQKGSNFLNLFRFKQMYKLILKYEM